MAKTDLASTIDAIEKDMAKKFGKGVISTMLNKPLQSIETVPTGSVALDIACGIMGIPKGRIVELFGPESQGKTTLALHIVAEAQRRGIVCAFIDAEYSLDLKYAKKLGVNTDSLLISQPEYGEQAFDIIKALVKTGDVGMVVVDSATALVPKSEYEASAEKVTMATQARMLSTNLRNLCGPASRSGTTIIFINQIRENIGVMFGTKTQTTGGRALKFYSSVRIEIKRIKTLPGSLLCKAKCVKNKLAPPFREAEMRIVFGEGFDLGFDAFYCGRTYGLIKKSGSSYTLPGSSKPIVGEEKVINLYRDNSKAREFLFKKLYKTIHTVAVQIEDEGMEQE